MPFRFYKFARSSMSPNFDVLYKLGWTTQWCTWEWCSYACSNPSLEFLTYVESVYTVVPFYHWEWCGTNFLDGHGLIDEYHVARYVLPFLPCEQGRLFNDTYQDEFAHLDVRGKRKQRRIRKH